MAKRKAHDPLAPVRSKPASVTSFRLNPAALRNEGFDCDALAAFPRELFACKNLESLELFRGIAWDGDNTIPPEIGSFTKLTSLSLGGLSFKKLPDTIGKLQRLTSLDVTYSEQLKELPDSIGRLAALEELQLGGTALKTIPASIGKLSRLTQLTLGDSVKSLPKETWNLKSLRELNLPDSLTKVPPGIGKLSNLESLSISAAALAGVATEIPKLERLRTLHVGGKARKLPEQLGELRGLKELGASYLGLEKLPSLARLQSLEKLEVAGNRLTELASIVRALPALKDLDFSENKLPRPEKKLIEQLMRLPPKKRGGVLAAPTPVKAAKPTLLGKVSSINASLSMLVADAKVAATWRGVTNGEGDQCDGSDWDRLREALDALACAPIDTEGGKALALSLEMGQGQVEVFRVGDRLVLVESFHGAEEDAEEREMFLDYVSGPPDRAKKVGTASAPSGVLVFMPSTDPCPDVAKRKKPTLDKGTRCGDEECGLMVLVKAGKHTVLLENEAKGSWGSGRRCHFVAVR